MDLILSRGRYFEEPLPSITNWVWVCSFPAGLATSVPTEFGLWQMDRLLLSAGGGNISTYGSNRVWSQDQLDRVRAVRANSNLTQTAVLDTQPTGYPN